MKSNEIYAEVTDRIIAALEDERIPWQRPWRVYGGVHKNFVSKKNYRGINQFMLDLIAADAGYRQPYWLTYKQIDKLGGQVRKGEKSTIIVFWKMIPDKEALKKDPECKATIPLLRYYRVFNVEQADGLEDKIPAIETSDFTPIERGQQIIDNMPDQPTIIHKDGNANYSPSLDTVTLPKTDSFEVPEYYYSTAYHELAHSTGHKTRLDRKLDAEFGSDPYAKEELVAEMTAAMLAGVAEVDIAPQQDNVKAYIQSWIRRFEDDHKLALQAAGQAQKAADFILGESS